MKTVKKMKNTISSCLWWLGKNRFIRTLSPQWKRLPLAGRNQDIGGETNDTPESCLAERGGKRTATTINYKLKSKEI